MNIAKRQALQKEIIDQSGQPTLILNDLILGHQGSEILASLIPQYHSTTLEHLEIKGNNIDSESFEIIFTALMCCPNLKSIQAEWNFLGSAPMGLEALCHLIKNSRFLEFIDLKNNRIAHNVCDLLSDTIRLNNKSLKVIDLRWNEIGEIGVQILLKALSHNSALKYLGLQDNRIGISSMKKVQEMLKNVSRGTGQFNQSSEGFRNSTYTINENESAATYFPLSQGSYPAMDTQVYNAQIRSKLENEQSEAELYQSKVRLEIQKVLNKLKSTGLRHHELQLKYDSLVNENSHVLNQLREAERVLGLEREKFMGFEKRLNAEKSNVRTEKYNINVKINSLMEKNVMKYQREIEELEAVMSDKMDRLQSYYRQRLNKKRTNREKLTELKEDNTKLKLEKQISWDQTSDTYGNSNQSTLQQRIIGLEELVAKSDFQNKSEQKQGQYLSNQLSSAVLKGLQREEALQKQIFSHQNEIKSTHSEMTTTNIEIEQNQSKCMLLQSNIIDCESDVEMRRKYVQYILSQSNVNVEIERLKQEQDHKGERLVAQTLDERISDVEKAIRAEQAQNKMIRNQYDKLLGQVEGNAKRAIQTVLFEQH